MTRALIRFSSVSLALVLCLGLMPGLSAGIARAGVIDTVWVDDDWTDAGNCGGHTWGVDAWNTIQGGIGLAHSRDTVQVGPGTYAEIGQIAITQDLTIVGDAVSPPLIKPNADTGSSGDARGWWFVSSGVAFNLSHVILDGVGRQVYQAIRSRGSGTIEDCTLRNIAYPSYQGMGIVIFGNPVTVKKCVFRDIGRIGVIAYGAGVLGALITENDYDGKANGDHLDYAFEVGAGAKATITNNIILDCAGVASSGGSTSAGILVTTYYGAGTQAVVEGNDIIFCDTGLAVGYDSSDTSQVTARYNNFDCAWGIASTGSQVDGTLNWWGSANGPAHASNKFNVGTQGDAVSNNVGFVPWLNSGVDSSPDPGFQPATGTSFAPVTTTNPVGGYASIQAGIDASDPGGTVNAAAGTYREQVVIGKNLTLQGSGSSVTTIESPDGADMTTFTTTRLTRAIVAVISPDPTDPAVTASISGFTVDGRGQAPNTDDNYVGVYFWGSNGSLTNSVVTRVRCSTVTEVQNVTAVLANHPYDVLVPTTVDISHNTVVDFQKVGIILNEWGTSGTVADNVVTGQGPIGATAQDGIQIGYGASADVSGNTVSALAYTGPGWRATGILIVGNTPDAAPPIAGTTVSGNTITDTEIAIDFAEDNTWVYGYASGTAHGNLVSGNTMGLHADCAPDTSIDATGNWWGDRSGPYNLAANPHGEGDEVSDNVVFDPWYIDEPTTILSDELHLTVSVAGSGTVTKDPDNGHYSYGDTVGLTAKPSEDWRFRYWTGDLTGSDNPTTLFMDGNKAATAVFGIVPPPPPPPPSPSDLGPFEGESEDGVIEIDVPEGISKNPVVLTIGDAENPPPTDGNPNLGAYDVELKDAKTGEAITELTKSITITFHYTPAMLAAAGVTDPHDLVIWYWDEDAEPACWVALPTVVDEATGTISTTVDHLTTFIAMVDADFPKLGDIAGHWAQTDILRLASYGAVGGYADGTFRPETAVTRAQFAKFIVATLGITPGAALPAGFRDASDVQDWAVPYLAACLRDGIMTGANGLLRPNATITRVEAAAMVVRALGLAVGSGRTGGVLTFSDAAAVPAWATAFVAEAVQHGLIAGLPGNVFDPTGTLTRAQAATVLSHAVDVK